MANCNKNKVPEIMFLNVSLHFWCTTEVHQHGAAIVHFFVKIEYIKRLLSLQQELCFTSKFQRITEL